MAINTFISARLRNIEAAGATLVPGKEHIWQHPQLPGLPLKKLPEGNIDLDSVHTLAFFDNNSREMLVLGGPALRWALVDPVLRVGRLLRQNQNTGNVARPFNYGIRRQLPKFCTSTTLTAGKGYMYYSADWSDTLMVTESYGQEYGSEYNLSTRLTHVAQVLTAADSTYIVQTNATTTGDTGVTIEGMNTFNSEVPTPVQGFLHRVLSLGNCRSVFLDQKIREAYVAQLDEEDARQFVRDNWASIVMDAFDPGDTLELGVTWDYARKKLVTRGNRVFVYDYAPQANAVTLREPLDGREPEYSPTVVSTDYTKLDTRLGLPQSYYGDVSQLEWKITPTNANGSACTYSVQERVFSQLVKLERRRLGSLDLQKWFEPVLPLNDVWPWGGEQYDDTTPLSLDALGFNAILSSGDSGNPEAAVADAGGAVLDLAESTASRGTSLAPSNFLLMVARLDNAVAKAG